MSGVCALAYVSTAVRRLNDAELEQLLRGARRFNASAGVGGALLYHDGSFFQYLEGDAPAVASAYRRVRASPLHTGIIELLHESMPRRHFEAWHMSFSHAPASMLLALSQARWQQARLDSGVGDNSGVQLLLAFWRRSGAADV